MIVYLFLAVMLSTSLIFGLPCGIIAGLRAARDKIDQSGAFKSGMVWVLVCHLLFTIVAFVFMQWYGWNTSPDTFEPADPAWIAWATFLFLLASFILWMPVYSLSFLVTRGLAR